MLRLRSIASTALYLSFALVLATSARAQGLLQLSLGGEVGVWAESENGNGRTTGHLVEVEIGAVLREQPVDLVMHLHLARGTTGAELAELVADRLKRIGVDVTATAPKGTRASLWIESARYANLRLGGGLTADLSCAAGPPSSMRVVPPSAIEQGGSVTVTASHALVMRDRPPLRGRAVTNIALDATTSSAAISAALLEATSETWISERPRGDSWRPVKMSNGATITGLSVELSSSKGGDWRIELAL